MPAINRTPEYYSNCLVEALRAKLDAPRHVYITVVRRSEAGCPHFLWSDGEYDYDFGVERRIGGLHILWFKGCIRQRELGFNTRYKKLMQKGTGSRWRG